MRVLCVGNLYPPHHLGGYEVIWQSAVAHMRRLGHEIRVLTTDHRAPGVEPEVEEDRDVHRERRWYWRDHRFPRLGSRARLALERHNARVFDRHLRELSPDRVNWWAMGGMSLSLLGRARAAGVPGAGVVCDDWLLYGPRVDAWTRVFLDRPRLGALAERAAGIPTRFDPEQESWLFMSEALRRRAREAGWQLAQARVAHRGVERELFPESPPEPWRWRLLYVGRIDPRKGIDTAVEALALLPAEATLAVVGGGDERHLADLRALVERLGLQGRVRFVSQRPREELAAVYAEADAVVFPVRWEEPWGLVPLEAMAVGRPVVATGTGGSGEYLRDGENCLLFGAAAGAEALAAALERLAGDEGLRERIRQGGRDTAESIDERSFNDAVAAALEAAGDPAEHRSGGRSTG